MVKVTDEIRRAFALFDKDGDGALSVAELQDVLTRPGGGQPLTDDDVRAVIAEFDENNDGGRVGLRGEGRGRESLLCFPYSCTTD